MTYIEIDTTNPGYGQKQCAGSTQAVVRQKVNSGAISHNLKILLTSTIYTFFRTIH